MASFDLPEIPQPRVSPALLVGVASPLWSYFGAVAAGGVAYWWMTQWARPVNLEALLGAAKVPLAPIAALMEPAVETVEVAAKAAEKAQDVAVETLAEAAPLPVGGEAAPVSPLVEAMPAPEPEPVAAPEPDAAPESFAEAAPAFEPTPEPFSQPAFEAAPEPAVDTAPEPVIEEPAPVSADSAPKARGKKAPPEA
jgi:hypothetical protein